MEGPTIACVNKRMNKIHRKLNDRKFLAFDSNTCLKSMAIVGEHCWVPTT
jgi:hypothetical protein